MTAPGERHPRVILLTLGGTIASTRQGPGGVSPALDGNDLVAAVPGLAQVADVTVQTASQLPGVHLQIQDVVALAGRAEDALRQGATGVVVTQGTDTLEETAFLLDLLVGGSGPVVVTGALRNPTLAGADGPANLHAAVAVAAAPAARGLGTLVVLNEEIHAARFVRKTHTSNPAAFTSYPGRLGWVSEGRPSIVLRPIGRLLLAAPADGEHHHVGLVSLAMGDDGRVLAGAARAGLDGLVVEALGGGHVPPAVLDDLGSLASRIPVVVTSTTRTGETLRATYGFAGSETDLASRGVISGGWLDARKARLLLTLLLGMGAGTDHIAKTMADPWA